MATNNVTNAGTRTPHSIAIAQGASTPNYLVLGAGQIPVGTTSSDPVATTLSAGTNVTVANSSGAITVGSYTMPASASGPATGISPYFVPLNLPGSIVTANTDCQTAGSASFFANNMIFIPFVLSDANNINSLNIFVLTGAGGSSCIMGVYNANTSTTAPPLSVYNLPVGAPIASGTATTTASNSFGSAGITSTSFTPGKLYWVGFQSSTASTLAYYVGVLATGAPNFITAAVGSGIVSAGLFYSNSFGSGMPTISSSSASGFTRTITPNVPAIFAGYFI